MTGERVGEHLYPFGRRVGPLYIAAVNSCRWNYWSWDSTGEVGAAQIERLETLLRCPAADGAIKILVTHYPIALATGLPEVKHRRLRDLDDLLRVAVQGGVQLWLHGHRHHSYVVPATPGRPITALCVGSGTMSNHWSYGEYLFEDGSMLVRQYTYQPEQGHYVQKQEQRLELLKPVAV
jgi:3',5'-cyclic AMP phosphodiesterase CpdA